MNFGVTKTALSKKQREALSNEFEDKIGVSYVEGPQTKLGYLANIRNATHVDQESGQERAAIYLFFVESNGNWFKCKFLYNPYFYILCDDSVIKEVVFYMNKTYEQQLNSCEAVQKEDLTLVNHLSGKTQRYIRLEFRNESDLMQVRKELLPQIKKNQQEQKTQEAYEGWYEQTNNLQNYLSKITDIREFDLNYQIRSQIDNEIRVSYWYNVELDGPLLKRFECDKDNHDKAQIRVLAFDIETTKQPLRFPDAKFDQIMMISYIIDGSGFLITNREVVSEDVEDFEYAPREDYDVGMFKVFNEPNEQGLLQKFFDHINETKPTVYTTFNGDNFDWPFIQARAEHYKMSIEKEIGIFYFEGGSNEYTGRFASHMDCLYWVKRDAFLPQGSHGLKAVTKAKLGYDPVELDPELMTPYAKERPQNLAEYSVSDAVATYFLYMMQIHDFIFALCTIIPTNPDDVLRRGSGTLCENLLMAQAYRANIIFPNKQVDDNEKFHKNKLIDSETYIGGHVECLQQGVFRSDFPVEFHIKKQAYLDLIEKVPQIMDFALLIEPGNQDKSKIENYDEIKDQIIKQLEALANQCPVLETEPLIYHVDVGAMYPNIILTNRLQPTAIVKEEFCAGCTFNKPENECKRRLDWQWKAELFTLNKGEYEGVKIQLQEEENFHTKVMTNIETQAYQQKLKQRVKQYCSGNYKKVHQSSQETRTDTVCMRENPFYVDTVRDFRDRRNEFKRFKAQWGRKLRETDPSDLNGVEKCKNMVALYESLQLAHKIILNSFYGYVMRKAARWYSMEMAAMVTHTGGNIIMDSRALYDQIGMPLELDTDGIWTLLPKGFPETFTFKFNDGKTFKFDFPCTMSNELIYEKYGNPQYQTLSKEGNLSYDKRLEMSIFFEIDGPYKCMLIPASTEEGKMLKKRYAVFNHAGKMTEVKGFEIKRRGELQIVKHFQQEVFTKFLEGSNLQECYDACGETAQFYYEILKSRGEFVNDDDLIGYIGESRVIQKSIEESGTQKSAAITAAKRLGEFLGADFSKEKGLVVKFVISRQPIKASVTERAIPIVALLHHDEALVKKFMRKWTGDQKADNKWTGGETTTDDYSLRAIVDWEYYMERLAGTIQKIVTIPAALQNCNNPVPQIAYPDWLHKLVKQKNDRFKQKKLGAYFKTADIEDIARQKRQGVQPIMNIKSESLHVQSVKPVPAIQAEKPKLKLENCPKPDDNFQEWLGYQKSNWRSIRAQIKQNKRLATTKQSTVQKQSAALTNFIRNMDDTVLNSVWHIFQIEPTFEPGILRLWAVTKEAQMFSVRLQVSRQVYINSKVVSTQADFKKVQKELPRGRKAYHLYEWESSEADFEQKFNKIRYTHLLSPNIEGIYETKVPPRFKALMQLGNTVRPIKQMLPRNEQALGRLYKLSELEVVTPSATESYLPDDCFQKVYLLHSYTAQRHLWGLFIEATHEVCFWCVNPNLKATQLAQGTLNLEAQFTKTLSELELDVDFAQWQVTEQRQMTDLTQVLKQIELKLQEYKQRNKSSTLLVLQSDLSNLHMMGLPSIGADFPVMKCPTVLGDNEYPALDWLRFAVRNMTIRFTEVPVWLGEKISFARYTVLPVCNLEQDSQSFVIDMLYSRSLSQHKHLLWYSEGQLPDLGGHEDKNVRLLFQDAISNPEQVNKGFYRTYCVEINIGNLALNTILQYDQMKEYQTLFSAIDQAKNSKRKSNATDVRQQEYFDADLDEFVACAPAFLKLNSLCKLWVTDSMEYQSEVASELLSHLYRWVTGASKLYDPLLHRMLHKMMSSNFKQLVHQLKQLHCKIVYASFQKIILQTNMRDYDQAQDHMNRVLHHIVHNEKDQSFKHLQLTTGEFWQILLFKDIQNYCGIQESAPEKMYMEMNIVRHLPESVRHKFKFTVMELLTKTLKFNRKIAADPLLMKQVSERANEYEDEAESDQVDHVEICRLISEHFSSKLLQHLEDILQFRKKALLEAENNSSEEEYDQEYDDEEAQQEMEQQEALRKQRQERRQKELTKWDFPQQIGSYNEYSVPALEFTKMLCNHVFGLDPAFQTQAQTLMKNMLQLLKIKEFSDEVMKGKEPSLTLVVPDVICPSCQASIDLDICRSTDLYEDHNLETARQVWPCRYCETPLSKEEIERRLLEILQRRVLAYQMQDLKCKACKMVCNHLVMPTCTCTGKFMQTAGHLMPETLRNQNLLNQLTDVKLVIRLMRNFGQRHEMQMLFASAESLLNLI